ncbi:hypothetical protein [Vibrio sp. WXL103]|uniref:hypothetical protein n=1 Tax=Vibrio sp. WXL103 TaxID=3450710 RepID=UPI003EC70B78
MLAKAEQLRLLDKVLRLSRAGLRQKDITKLLIKFGTAKEKEIGESCASSLQRGFSAGLKPYLSQNAYMALSSGEHVGDFQLGISDAINALNVDEASTSNIIKALWKPILSVIAMLLSSAGLGAWAFPYLADISPRYRWGWLSLKAEQFALFWLNHGLWLAGLTVILAFALVYSLSRYTGRYRSILDRAPIYRQYRYIQCTNMLTAIAHQLTAGTELKRALRHYHQHTSRYMGHHTEKMLLTLRRGKLNIGEIFNTQLLEAEELETLKMLNDTGNYAVLLKSSAERHSETLLDEINQLKRWASWLLMGLSIVMFAWMTAGLGIVAFKAASQMSTF